ncbi:MAG: PadR family transcriptional regulator [Longimicrobiales bacterium]
MKREDFDFDFIFGGPGAWGDWGAPSWKDWEPRVRRAKRRRKRHGRRDSWKWFQRGDLKFAILALIEDKPMHGYEVMQALEEQSAGCYKASAGSIYPTLQLLEDQGFISPADRDGKKVYSITDEGRAFLEENRAKVDDIFSRVSDFSDRFFGKGMAELSRSFSRLAQTTFQGAMGWVEDEALLSDMKDILNGAVRDMEAAWDQAAARRRKERSPGSRSKRSAGGATKNDEAKSAEEE